MADLITGFTAVGALIVAFVALFQQQISSWISHPKLEPSFQPEIPYCLHQKLKTGKNSYYTRIKISNIGEVHADHAEVFASALESISQDGTCHQVPNFIPMNLKWADFNKPSVHSINPDTHRYCDIFYIVQPDEPSPPQDSEHNLTKAAQSEPVLIFDTMIQFNDINRIHEPGTYLLTLLVGARNTPPYLLSPEYPLVWHMEG